MSDQPQGEGWWLASDGKYYPPDSAPGRPHGGDGEEAQVGARTAPTVVTSPEEHGRPVFKRWWFWLLVVVGLIVIIGIVASEGSTEDTASTTASPEVTPTEDATPTETEEATPTAAAQEPEPAPEPEPEPEPEPAPPAPPQTYSGAGDTVLPIQKPADVVTVAITHDGSSNFAVKNLDANLNQIDLLVNTIGPYQGTVLMDIQVGEQSTALEIGADGAWTVTLANVATAPRFADQTSGQGDSVLIYEGTAGVAQVSNQGEGNFAIKYYNDRGADLLVNEIGNYGGQVPFRSPPAIVEVNSEGSWSIIVT